MVVSLLLCFLPVIAGIFILRAFKIKITHSVIAVLASLLIIFPISLIQFFTGGISLSFGIPVLGVLLRSFLIYGLIEESLKGVSILFFPKLMKDSISYSEKQFAAIAFFFGLSLGCFESEVYFFSHLMQANSWGATLMYQPILLRMITSDLLHGFCAAISGVFIWKWNNGDKHTFFILSPVLIHTFYDFFAGFQNNLKYFSIAVLLYALFRCTSLLEKKDKESPAANSQ